MRHTACLLITVRGTDATVAQVPGSFLAGEADGEEEGVCVLAGSLLQSSSYSGLFGVNTSFL